MSQRPDTAAIWVRPELTARGHQSSAGAPRPTTDLDTALFDVDGVLIDTRRSYRLAVAHGAEHLVRVVNGLRDAPSPMVTPEDVALFKLAGGFNSDWDATQLFAALWTARLREWRGQPEAALSLAAWAARARAAAEQGRGGVTWLHATVPATAIPDAETARWAHDEFYWGAALVGELYAHTPRFAPHAPGFVHNELPLLAADTLPALVALGISRFGLITGRVGPEVNWAVRALAAHCGREGTGADGLVWADGEYGWSPFGCIVPATVFAKPDPRALVHALRTLEARSALYVGDTADDLDLVLRYRAGPQREEPNLPPVLAVMVARADEARTYRQRGADIIVPHVRNLPEALRLLADGERTG
jgi:phosphoglycolate phosphatase-like HAD superfamily hydrolase